jgi:exosortase/archaeosortase family protein
MATVYGFGWFSGVWKRVLVLASAVPFAILGNLVRMLSIIIAAEVGGQKLGNSIHDSSVFSMLPYIPAILGLFLLGRWLHETPQSSLQNSAPQHFHEPNATGTEIIAQLNG